jgi:peroxiredoxin
MRLQQGIPAPHFEGKTLDGKSISVESYRGKKLWLCFYRYASCPVCNLHISRIIRNYGEIRKAGVEVLAIFESNPEHFPAMLGGATQVPFTVIADPQKKIYAQYGLEKKGILSLLKPRVIHALFQASGEGFKQGKIDGELGQIPAEFLIREDGVIHTAFYGTHVADHIPWWQVERFMGEESVEEWKKRVGARSGA